MRTLLALGAAALIASAGAAEAKSKTYTVSLNGHCDVLTLNITGSVVAGTDDPSCAAGFGGGLIGKVKGFGNAIVAGVQFPSRPGQQYVLELSYPLVTGGSWNLYLTSDGIKLNKFENGTYTVQGTPTQGPRGATPVVGR